MSQQSHVIYIVNQQRQLLIHLSDAAGKGLQEGRSSMETASKQFDTVA